MRSQNLKEENWPVLVKAGSSTVKIYRVENRGKDAYNISWHEGAQRKRRMYADFVKARTEAKIIAETINAGQGDTLRLTSKDREAFETAMRLLNPLGIGLAAAASEYVEAKKVGVPLLVACKFYHKTHHSKLPEKSVADVFAEMLEAKKIDGCSEAYLHDLKVRLSHFSRDFRVIIGSIDTPQIDGWLRALKLSPRSRNNYRNAISGLFSFARSRGYLDRDRATAAKFTDLARKQVEAIEVFTPDEFCKLLTNANDLTLPFLVFGGLCGLRTEEILRLQWDDVRWAESSIVIRAAVAKTRTRRLAPLTDAAAAWMAKYQIKTGRVMTTDQPHQHTRELCKALGITWKHNGLRHSFISYRVACNKDFVRVAYDCGNSPAIIKSNYDAVCTEAEAIKWFSIAPGTAANVLRMKATG